MKRSIVILILLLFCVTFTNAQDTPFDKDRFPDKKTELKEALKELKNGDKYYAEGTAFFKNAIPYYERAYGFNPNNSDLNYKLGVCYLKGTADKVKSLSYLEKAFELNPSVNKKVTYYMGIAYHLNEKWDEAIDKYNVYLNNLPSESSFQLIEKVKKKIGECEYGKEMSKNPTRVFIDNIGPEINTAAPEYAPVISTDESIMMFTSRRASTTGGEKDEFSNDYFEDIYYSERVGDDKWSPAINIGKPINSDNHDATVGISPDGQKLLTFIEGDLYLCELKGSEWSKPKKLGKEVNTEHHESSASYSFDGRTLYFVSDRPDGSLGGRDIYRSSWDDKKERWGPPSNLGPIINTKFDEESVFAHPDGKTIYFSSKGHKTMGGFDIFKSEFDNGKWSKPENLGYPINSSDDDYSFVLAANGRKGYYASAKQNGKGGRDIYIITFLGPEKQVILNTEDNLLAGLDAPIKEIVIEPAVEVSASRVTIFKGTVTDEETEEPLEAEIQVIDNELKEEVAQFLSNSNTGKFLLSLPSGKNYGISVKTEGYLFHSENFVIPSSAAYKEIRKDIKMQKLKVGKKIVLNNIFFETGKYELSEASYVELTNLYELMKANPNIKVEISGHTDNVGSDSYNQKLSENRAKAVVDYLIKLGIPTAQMVYKGYGEEAPVADNETEEGRALNRRTEFKVLEEN